MSWNISLNPFSTPDQLDKNRKEQVHFNKRVSQKPSGLLNSDKNNSFDEFISQSFVKTNPLAAKIKNIQKTPQSNMTKQTAQAQSVLSKSLLNETCFVGNIASSFLKLIDLRDSYTGSHSKIVRKQAISLAKKANLSDSEIEAIGLGSVFHDIGKIGTPENILNKQSKLNDEEIDEIKKHPVTGSEILKSIPSFKGSVSDIIRHHHESWDGNGYPDGLAGKNIPIGARIVAIVDSYHAMTSDRPYRKGMSQREAVNRLKTGAGTQWDPDLTNKFIEIINSSKNKYL